MIHDRRSLHVSDGSAATSCSFHTSGHIRRL
jgi:hypothetical protein